MKIPDSTLNWSITYSSIDDTYTTSMMNDYSFQKFYSCTNNNSIQDLISSSILDLS